MVTSVGGEATLCRQRGVGVVVWVVGLSNDKVLGK